MDYEYRNEKIPFEKLHQLLEKMTIAALWLNKQNKKSISRQSRMIPQNSLVCGKEGMEIIRIVLLLIVNIDPVFALLTWLSQIMQLKLGRLADFNILVIELNLCQSDPRWDRAVEERTQGARFPSTSCRGVEPAFLLFAQMWFRTHEFIGNMIKTPKAIKINKVYYIIYNV